MPVFLGFAVGIASFITPLYLSETAPAAIRGSMGSLFQLMITIGIFVISVTNVYIATVFVEAQAALPMMFLVISLFAFLMFIGSIVLPESPRWLMLKQRKAEAIRVLQRTVNTQKEVDLEIAEIEQVLVESRGDTLKSIMNKHFVKILIIGVVLQMFQQLVGINVMIYYAPTIFGYAGMKGLLAMLLVPTVNMLFTIPAVYLVEKWGRKKLLYVGAIIMFISMAAAGLAFHSIGAVTDVNLISQMPKTVLLVAVIVYIFGFAFSLGPGGLDCLRRHFSAKRPGSGYDHYNYGKLDVCGIGDALRLELYGYLWQAFTVLLIFGILYSGHLLSSPGLFPKLKRYT